MNKWLNKLKVKAILPAAALFAAAAIGTTFAWQHWELSVTNELKAHTTEVTVKETFDKKKKENVSFQNTGTSSVFLRVAYSEYWETGEDKRILSNTGETGGAVASIVWPEDFSTNWTHCSDGWYYYNRSLQANEETELFLVSAQASTDSLPKEYEGAKYQLYLKAEVVQCSDGFHTANSDEVNEKAIQEIFGRNVTVGGKDKHIGGTYDLTWKQDTNGKYYYIGQWK